MLLISLYLWYKICTAITSKNIECYSSSFDCVLFYEVLAEFQYWLTKCKLSKKVQRALENGDFCPRQWFGHPWHNMLGIQISIVSRSRMSRRQDWTDAKKWRELDMNVQCVFGLYMARLDPFDRLGLSAESSVERYSIRAGQPQIWPTFQSSLLNRNCLKV